MFRKIHSNRDPGDTLVSEIKKEFGTYFGKAGTCFSGCMARYPKFIFGSMVFSIVVSLALAFTVFRRHPPVPKPIQKKPAVVSVSPLNDGFSRIMQLSSAIHETMALKKQVDSLIGKKQLSPQDSLILEQDLDRLQKIKP